MSKLEKNRVFDQGKLKELGQNCVKLMNQAIKTSKDTETELKKIKGILSRVPAEAKEHRLQTEIDRIAGKLNKQEFTVMKTKAPKTLAKLMEQVPKQDTAFGKKQDTVKDDAKKVEKAAQDLRKLISGGISPGNYKEFAKKLDDLKGSWQINEVIKKDLLAAVIQRMKQLNGKDPVNEYSVDPVNLSTGNFIYEKEELKVFGVIPLSFKRFYNALDDREGSMGSGWVHNYEVCLKIEEESCLLVREEGAQERFVKETPQLYRSFRNGREKIEVIIPESTKTDDSNGIKGFIYTNRKGLRYTFNDCGNLTSQKDVNGNTLHFTYDQEGKLEQVKSDGEEALCYTYEQSGKLSCVTDRTGRRVSLEYRNGKLRKVTDPMGSVLSYTYTKEGKIAGVTSPGAITSLLNTYDKNNRITKQRFPDNSQMSYAYQDEKKQVVLTERNGSRVTYVHDDRYRSVKNIYADGEECFAYNDRDERVMYRDKLGNETRYAYDGTGNLSQVVNALGHELELNYDGQYHKITCLRLNGSVKVRNEYDKHGNLVKMSDAAGRVQQFFYNQKGLITKVLYADESCGEFSYDSRGNLIQVIDQRGNTNAYEYDSLNRVIKTIDGNGNETSYQYNLKNQITEVCNALGEKQYYSYNESGKLTGVRRFDGSTVTCEYNEINRPKRIVDALGNETVYEYDRMWNVSKKTGPDGAETKYHYNRLNQLEYEENPLGGRTCYVYDPNGNCIKITGADGGTTSYTYDAVNRRTEIIQSGGEKTQYVYDDEGRVIKVIDALGGVSVYTYDEAGQMIEAADALGNSRKYTYNQLGQVLTETDPAGRRKRYEYEKGGLLSAVYHMDGSWETYTYDRNQNVIRAESSKSGTVEYKYDKLNRIRSIADSQGQEKHYAYDAAGNVVSMTDAMGHTTGYGYDEEGHLIRVTDALGGVTVYQYDAAGNLAESRQYGYGCEEKSESYGEDTQLAKAEELNRKNREFCRTVYSRNKLGQVTEVTDALGGTESYCYDTRGRVIRKTDKEGYETSYGYTSQGDISLVEYADGRKVSFSYDALRRLEEIEDWLGTTKIEKDALGRPVKVTDYKEREVSYSWGKCGEKKRIIYPNGNKVDYGYDEFLRLNKVKDVNTEVSYQYDGIGLLEEKVFQNGQKTAYQYDISGRLKQLSHWNQDEILERYEYDYDLRGNTVGINKIRRGLAEESGYYRYQYDAMSRLQTVIKDGVFRKEYHYDSLGNRTESIEEHRKTLYRYNELNQLVSKYDADSEGMHAGRILETYSYDKRGNMTEIHKNGTLINQYHFDEGNRLDAAVNYDTGMAASYQYNGLGQRIGKVEGIPIEPIMSGTDISRLELCPTRKIDDVLDITKQYHNLLQRNENENITTFTWDDNVLSAAGRKGNWNYFQDELGSTVRMISKNGKEEMYGYDEFGQDLYQVENISQPFGFTGYQRDEITNTCFAQAREYQPGMGRFISRDMIKGNIVHPFTMNEYGYCWNRPLDLVDLDGMLPSIAGGLNKLFEYFWETDLGKEIINLDFSNKDPQKVIDAKYISAYDGQYAIRWTPDVNGRPGSFGPIMFLDGEEEDPEMVKHERGHYDQYQQLGILKYLLGIGYPSAVNGNANNYYSQPWEVTADMYGGVNRQSPHLEGSEELGERYLEYLKSINSVVDWAEFLKKLPNIKNNDMSFLDEECP